MAYQNPIHIYTQDELFDRLNVLRDEVLEFQDQTLGLLYRSILNRLMILVDQNMISTYRAVFYSLRRIYQNLDITDDVVRVLVDLVYEQTNVRTHNLLFLYVVDIFF